MCMLVSSVFVTPMMILPFLLCTVVVHASSCDSSLSSSSQVAKPRTFHRIRYLIIMHSIRNIFPAPLQFFLFVFLDGFKSARRAAKMIWIKFFRQILYDADWRPTFIRVPKNNHLATLIVTGSYQSGPRNLGRLRPCAVSLPNSNISRKRSHRIGVDPIFGDQSRVEQGSLYVIQMSCLIFECLPHKG